MPSINLTKTSGIIQIRTVGSITPATYFSPRGSSKPNSAGTGVDIVINGDSYAIPLTDLQVNGQTPTTMATALTLLSSIFGT